MPVLDKIKDMFSLSRFRENRFLSPLLIRYESLPPDQKQIARLSGIGVGLFLILLMLSIGYRSVKTLREDLESKQDILKKLSQYEDKFHYQTNLLKRLEKEAKRKSADFSLLATLETLAQSASIGRESIESISPKQLPPGKYFIETEATVQIVHVTLRQLIDYFHKIESSTYHLTLKEARIKPRFDDPQFLNVTFKVSSFMPKE